MKVMHIIEPFSYGGVEKMVLYLCKYFNRDNHEIHIAVPTNLYDNIADYYKEYAIIHKMEYRMNPLLACFYISKLIKKVQPDIVHTHARRTTVFTCLVNNNIPHIRTYHMQEYEKISKSELEYKLLRKRVSGWAVTWHGIIETDLKKARIDAPVKIIHNGVPEIKVEKSKKIKRQNVNFLFIGRLSYQKGLDILLDGLKLLPQNLLSQIQIRVVGEGELEKQLKEKNKQLGLENVMFFEGFKRELSPFYKESDILLMPSRYEGLPLSLIEAMSCSTPVASTSVGAATSIIKNDINGWLINENNAENWANFFKKIMNLNFDEIVTIGRNAKVTYEKSFRVEAMYDQYINYYNELLNNKDL